jgi:hypothetical protein
MKLRCSPTGRHLLRPDGKPFFFLADTAWELFHRLTLDEARHYLRVRAGQNFNVIEAVLLAEFDGLRTPNAAGLLPLVDLDPTRPSEPYFAFCDAIIHEAQRLGLIMALLPSWGDKWTPNWGAGPTVFNPSNAFTYGAYLGERYRDAPVIWILGGDRPIHHAHHLHIIRQMARGIRSKSPDQLMTFHPPGGDSSARYVHSEDWLDFNMLQTGHTGKDNPVIRMISLDVARNPPKPTLDGEPNYEDSPVFIIDNGWKPTAEYFDDFQCRKQAWRSLLSGAAGHTYGCHDVWQFWDRQREPVNLPRHFWHEALTLPGARQMMHLRSLFESIEWQNLVSDPSLLGPSLGDTAATEAVAAASHDGSLALFYIPTSRQIPTPLKSPRFQGRKLSHATWLNPASGTRTPLQINDVSEVSDLTPPPADQPDWVLICETSPS